ncbi:MAG TPA: DUF3782 domain-containing protein, partial [Armatimonadetes bacterium]|nr:DUF3782 domain-containing protein [Armatimonadota bacterium]
DELTKAVGSLAKAIENHSKRFDEFDRKLMALGARWGVMAEDAFRGAMRGVLTDIGYRVRKWRVRDEAGKVFGHPTMVEVDVLIYNDQRVLIEIKSSISPGDVASFSRVGELYEELTGIKPKLVIVSPFIDVKAKNLCDSMGIEYYTHPEEVVGEEPPSRQVP